MVRLRQELLEGSLLQYLLCFLSTEKVCLFTNTTRLELSFIPPLARGKLAFSRSHLKHWRAAAAQRGTKNRSDFCSYSMDNNMLPSVRQQNRVIMCNACHDICMSPVCCFEVASGSRSSTYRWRAAAHLSTRLFTFCLPARRLPQAHL